MTKCRSLKKIFSICFMLLILTFTLTACGKPTGNWVYDNADANAIENASGTYPQSMTLNSDGTGSADGVSLNWYTEGDTLTLQLGFWGNLSYTYKVSGNHLTLDGYRYNKQ